LIYDTLVLVTPATAACTIPGLTGLRGRDLGRGHVRRGGVHYLLASFGLRRAMASTSAGRGEGGSSTVR
jgi:hypothetical protein